MLYRTVLYFGVQRLAQSTVAVLDVKSRQVKDRAPFIILPCRSPRVHSHTPLRRSRTIRRRPQTQMQSLRLTASAYGAASSSNQRRRRTGSETGGAWSLQIAIRSQLAARGWGLTGTQRIPARMEEDVEVLPVGCNRNAE